MSNGLGTTMSALPAVSVSKMLPDPAYQVAEHCASLQLWLLLVETTGHAKSSLWGTCLAVTTPCILQILAGTIPMLQAVVQNPQHDITCMADDQVCSRDMFC